MSSPQIETGTVPFRPTSQHLCGFTERQELPVPTWLKRVRAALGMGLLWGVLWAVIGGGIMEGVIDPNGQIVDMWPQLLGMIGFMGGVIFSTLVRVAGARKSFEEFTFREFATLGAVAGALQGIVAVFIFGAPLLFIGIAALGSALSAIGSLAAARAADRARIGRGSGDAQRHLPS